MVLSKPTNITQDYKTDRKVYPVNICAGYTKIVNDYRIKIMIL